MKNVFKNIIALVILCTAIYIFRGSLAKSYFILQDKYFPCTRVITYSLGTVDSGFELSKEDFLSTIKDGERMWETAVNKNLFTYVPAGGELTINLVYDKRQENTQIMNNIDSSIKNNQSSYDGLKNEVDSLKNEFEVKKSNLENKINTLKNKNGRYTKESINEINGLQAELNNFVVKINKAVDELNKSAYSINSQATQYNHIGDELGDQFEEGLYHSDRSGKYIDIYQFENKEKLERVLMHELGHALSLDHLNNPDDIMYAMNTGINLVPTEDDINALKAHCEVE